MTGAERPYLVKLVRDHVGLFLGGDGVVEYRPIEDRGLQIDLLRGKLAEEALEYFKNPSIGEAADVPQVIYDLVELDLCLDRADLEAARADKFNERGGFLGGLGMFVTTTAPDPRDVELGEQMARLDRAAPRERPKVDPREFKVGDRVEVLGGDHDGKVGTYRGVAPKQDEGDEDGYMVALDAEEGEETAPVWVKYLYLRPPRA